VQVEFFEVIRILKVVNEDTILHIGDRQFFRIHRVLGVILLS
jgi:hypothetical protein